MAKNPKKLIDTVTIGSLRILDMVPKFELIGINEIWQLKPLGQINMKKYIGERDGIVRDSIVATCYQVQD